MFIISIPLVCPNDTMILVDCCYNNRRLLVFNDDGTLDKEIPCVLGYPFGVTYLDDRTVAVSADNGIEIINIDTKKTERCINTSKWCYGYIFSLHVAI
jgi:hypothetical protein